MPASAFGHGPPSSLRKAAILLVLLGEESAAEIYRNLPDQDVGERASVFIPFFGVPAATVTALSRIAQSTNAVVLPCINRILPRGRGYEMCFYPALDNFPTEDPLADARRMNEEVEKWVREMPEQYLWSYRRFKTRPNNEPSLYDKK